MPKASKSRTSSARAALPADDVAKISSETVEYLLNSFFLYQPARCIAGGRLHKSADAARHALACYLSPYALMHRLHIQRHDDKRVGLEGRYRTQSIFKTVVDIYRSAEICGTEVSAGYLVAVMHGQQVDKCIVRSEYGTAAGLR